MPHAGRTACLIAALWGGCLALQLAPRRATPAGLAAAPVVSVAGRVPESIGGHRSLGDNPLDDRTRGELGAAEVVARTYAPEGLAGDAALIDFVMIGGADRFALHDVRSCMTGAGWTVGNDRLEVIPGTAVTARACRLTGGPGGAACEALYFYVVDGRVVSHVTRIRGEMMLAALTGGGGKRTYFVRFLRRLPEPGSPAAEPQAAAWQSRRFREFAGSMVLALDLPGTRPAGGDARVATTPAAAEGT